MGGTDVNSLIIIGASGHGKVVADIAKLVGYADIIFLDNNTEIKECAGYPILGSDARLKDFEGDVFIAVGASKARKTLMERYADRTYPTLVHPNAVIAEGVTIGDGSVVMAGAIINPSSIIGRGCIVNTSSSIDHDCVVGDYSHIAVGAHLCGTVEVGENCWIGAGAVVSNNIAIESDATIGAGAVVIRDVKEKSTVVGNPAKPIRYSE